MNVAFLNFRLLMLGTLAFGHLPIPVALTILDYQYSLCCARSLSLVGRRKEGKVRQGILTEGKAQYS